MSATAVARVSVTVWSVMTGATVVLSVTGPSVPSRGVFFTAKAVFARFAAAARSSSKAMVSMVALTAADANAGAVVSGVAFVTARSVKVATSLPAASSSRLFASVPGTS